MTLEERAEKIYAGTREIWTCTQIHAELREVRAEAEEAAFKRVMDDCVEQLVELRAHVRVLRDALVEIERRANEYVETTPEYTYGIIARDALKKAGNVG